MQQYSRPLRMGKPLQECNLRTCMEPHGRWLCAIMHACMHARCSEQIENVRSVGIREVCGKFRKRRDECFCTSGSMLFGFASTRRCASCL